jgi:F-type H+-transporting ATPase subunit b
MPQLDPTWFASQFFWLLLTFVTLYAVLSRLILPSLLGVMAGRRSTIDSDLQKAQSLKEQAEHARDDYQRTLADARMRAQALIDEALAEQKARADKAATDMDATVSAKLSEAERKIAARKAELIDHLAPTAGELTAMIVEKLTKLPANADKVAALLHELSKPHSNR